MSIIGSIIGAVGNIATSAMANRAQSKLADKQIAAQKEANDRNIEFQREANQQNLQTQRDINNQQIAFQKDVNSLMRHDANNAISIKKQDLVNAGYSTADPNMTGATSASLGSPTLGAASVDAPQVQSEFTPDMARMLSESYNSLSGSLLSGASLGAQIALQEAQARSANANASGQEIDNNWKDAQNAASYEQLLESIELMKKDGKIKNKQASLLSAQIDNMRTQTDSLTEQILSLRMENMLKPDMLIEDLNHLRATISNVKASTANLNADTSNKRVEHEILKYSKDIKKIERNFARMGINFNGNSIFDSLARLVSSPDGHVLFSRSLDFLSKSVDAIFGRLSSDAAIGAMPFVSGSSLAPILLKHYLGK